MRRIYKKLIALVIVILIIPAFAINSFAAAMLTGGQRWCHMSSIYNGTGYTNSCILTISTTYLTGNWVSNFEDTTQTMAQRAIYVWNNHSDGLVKTATVPYGSANIDLITYSGTQAQWDDTFGDGTSAFVVLFDKEGNQYSFGLFSGDVSLANFGNRINAADIYFAPNYIPANSDGETIDEYYVKTIVHEIGHCINLGHPSGTPDSTYVRAVMQQGYDIDDWDGYPNPTSHDKDSYRSLYTQIYS